MGQSTVTFDRQVSVNANVTVVVDIEMVGST